jgi:PQQ-dependent dehydrogenase (methanol/ethanol family)
MRIKASAKGGLSERRWRRIGVGVALAALLCLGSSAQAADPDEDGQWVMPGKNHAGFRFSGLDQINVGNASNLQVAWTFSVGVLRGQEAAPIVADNTMFVVTPYPNILYALDLTKPGGPLKWKFEPQPASAAQGVACCDTVNRGAAYSGGKVFFNTLDDQTIAVDAKTGQEVWRAKLGDMNQGETMTMAPLVVKDKVLVGNSGGELGVRGWITALDASTGKIAWRAYSVGPDADVLIGDQFHPFYEQDRGTDLGVRSWPPEAWKIGGGTVWGWVTYDPAANLVYYGTANPGPWNPDQRPGDNKWTSGIFARDLDTGQARWFYQWSPHDLHDYDGVNESVLVDLDYGGKARKLLVHPDRNGYLYLMDRGTGEVLYAKPFVHITTSTGVDLETGRLQYNPAAKPVPGQVVRNGCPASPGAKDWQPSAFSPKTKFLYIPHNNLCQDVEATQTSYIAGTPYVGMDVRMNTGPGGHRGKFSAWDVAKGEEVWGIDEDFPAWSGAAVTAGGIVFYGTMEGWFKAVNAETGKELWKFKTGSGIIGQPTVYRGPDGNEYVAILSGVGGWSGAIVAGGLDPRDGSAALGFVNAMRDLPDKTARGGTLYVFALRQ